MKFWSQSKIATSYGIMWAQCEYSATAQALSELWLLRLQMTQAILSTYNKIIVIDNIV